MSSKRKEQVKAVVYMIIISVVFTGLVSGVNVMMKDGIAENLKAQTAEGILEAFDLITGNEEPEELAKLFEQNITKIDKNDEVYYRYTTDTGKVAGYAFQLQGEGYWGPVYGYLAVKPDGHEIIDIAVVRHTETPGLGGRIAETWFTDQFKGRNLNPETNEGNPLRLVQSGKKKNPQDVDSITGATGTSKAFETILHNTYEHILEILKDN